jgi:hypothetical protein
MQMQQRPVGPGGPGGPQMQQQPPQGQMQRPQQPAQAPIKPYKMIAVGMPQPLNDPSFEAFRKQLADIAAKKDRNALARLVVAQGFFLDTEQGDKADKTKPGIVNLDQAVGGLSGPNAQGWDGIAQASEDPTAEPLQGHNGVVCGPAGPQFDEKGFEEVIKATGTEPGDWGFTTTPNLEARSAGQANAPVVEKLPLMLLRVLVDQPPAGAPQNQQAAPQFAHVVLPSGKTAFISMDAISPLGFDQICYVKDASGWKIAGFESAQ